MTTSMEYSRVNLNEDSSDNDAKILVRVLFGQLKYEFSCSPSETILNLKERISAQNATLSPNKQRLIVSGREMKPDSCTLDKYNDRINDSLLIIHCFPRPNEEAIRIATATTPSSSTNGVAIASPAVLGEAPTHLHTHRNRWGAPFPRHNFPLDERVLTSARDVRMWSFILLFISGSTLFNNISYFFATRTFGRGPIDSLVMLLQTGCSVAGLHVSQLGLLASRSIDIEDITKYVKYLSFLMLFNVIERICWVVDLTRQVKEAYKHQQEEENTNNDNDNGGGNNDGNQTDDLTNENQHIKITPQLIYDFTLQVIVIAMVGIFCWVACVARAHRFYYIVQRNTESEAGTTRHISYFSYFTNWQRVPTSEDGDSNSDIYSQGSSNRSVTTTDDVVSEISLPAAEVTVPIQASVELATIEVNGEGHEEERGEEEASRRSNDPNAVVVNPILGAEIV